MQVFVHGYSALSQGKRAIITKLYNIVFLHYDVDYAQIRLFNLFFF